MIHLKRVTKIKIPKDKQKLFPFSAPVISSFSQLDFTREVTFFVGENGSGKSTLLESIAAACGLPIVGSQNINQDDTMKHASQLAEHLSLGWSIKSHKGFFLRAEDFFGFTRRLNQLRADLQSEINQFNKDLPDGYGKNLAIGSIRNQLEELTARYGVDLDAGSHGESFLKLFQSRIKPNGLYLLDEPETPLSPIRQMSLLKIIHDAIKQNCQFIIATHSPIIMAFPSAQILDFNDLPPKQINYEDISHVQIFKSFLSNKDRYLKELGL